jgi:hypothetical protein
MILGKDYMRSLVDSLFIGVGNVSGQPALLSTVGVMAVDVYSINTMSFHTLYQALPHFFQQLLGKNNSFPTDLFRGFTHNTQVLLSLLSFIYKKIVVINVTEFLKVKTHNGGLEGRGV